MRIRNPIEPSPNSVAGLWWADPAAALFIAAVAVKEGRESWRGEGRADGCC